MPPFTACSVSNLIRHRPGRCDGVDVVVGHVAAGGAFGSRKARTATINAIFEDVRAVFFGLSRPDTSVLSRKSLCGVPVKNGVVIAGLRKEELVIRSVSYFRFYERDSSQHCFIIVIPLSSTAVS